MYKKIGMAFANLVFVLAFFLVFVPGMLSYEKRIPANILVVEGWLPHNALNVAYQEFQSGKYDFVLFTGSMLHHHTTLYVNSFLVVYPTQDMSLLTGTEFIFDIQAKSSLGIKDSAHFVFWINDKAVADFYTTEESGNYTFLWDGELANVDSLMIQYTNDMYSARGDRNLIIEGLQINHNKVITRDTPRYVDKGLPFGRYRWSVKAASYADMAANYFMDRLEEKERVIAVSNPHTDKRRTYGNALALRSWLENNTQRSVAINIVSIDYHSRRTWMVYNKVLKDNAEVGIISVKNVRKEATLSRKYHYIVRESVAMLYYCIFIFPWI